MKKRLSRLVLALGIAGASLSASANTPRELDDLVGVRASSGSSAMQQRGWVHIDSERGPDRIYSHYWDPRSRTCVNVNVMDGRFRSINSVPSFDCNQQAGGGEDDDDDAKAAAIAVGAAALIGALALAHKSHHHDDNQHYDDRNAEAEYDRGYRDGQYHHTYDNHNGTDAYRNGYEAGADSREHHGTRHQQHASHANHGYPQPAGFKDLEGARASSADSALRKRGFHDVDGFKSGNASYTIWYKRNTHQCLQVTTANGRIEDLRDIHQHPNCH